MKSCTLQDKGEGGGECDENLPGKSYALKQEERWGRHIVSHGKPINSKTHVEQYNYKLRFTSCSEHFLLITF